MGLIVLAILVGVCTGFAVALGTQFLLGRAKAHQYPGGSLSAGLVTGLAFHAGIAPVILGAVFGVVGWILYRVLFPVR